MEEQILQMLAELCEDDIVKDERDLDLFETGLLDSLAFAELLIRAEMDFHAVISPSEVDRADINTPAKIVRLISERASA